MNWKTITVMVLILVIIAVVLYFVFKSDPTPTTSCTEDSDCDDGYTCYECDGEGVCDVTCTSGTYNCDAGDCDTNSECGSDQMEYPCYGTTVCAAICDDGYTYDCVTKKCELDCGSEAPYTCSGVDICDVVCDNDNYSYYDCDTGTCQLTCPTDMSLEVCSNVSDRCVSPCGSDQSYSCSEGKCVTTDNGGFSCDITTDLPSMAITGCASSDKCCYSSVAKSSICFVNPNTYFLSQEVDSAASQYGCDVLMFREQYQDAATRTDWPTIPYSYDYQSSIGLCPVDVSGVDSSTGTVTEQNNSTKKSNASVLKRSWFEKRKMKKMTKNLRENSNTLVGVPKELQIEANNNRFNLNSFDNEWGTTSLDVNEPIAGASSWSWYVQNYSSRYIRVTGGEYTYYDWQPDTPIDVFSTIVPPNAKTTDSPVSIVFTESYSHFYMKFEYSTDGIHFYNLKGILVGSPPATTTDINDFKGYGNYWDTVYSSGNDLFTFQDTDCITELPSLGNMGAVCS
ncbi:MAG: hypothetical protein JKX76_01165 [Colwellia sp.]|nr:hypothetical protein [Colwellia sp.]